MKELAVLLRKLQLFTHNAHNLIQGENFLPYHELLGELYPAYEADYDDVVERIIGLYGTESIDLLAIQMSAVQKLQEYPIGPSDALGMFKVILHCEKELQDYVNKLCKNPSVTEGSKQLIGEIANKSEMRSYKLKQIMKSKASELKV
jgi:DNA-binding ferritin-like protein